MSVEDHKTIGNIIGDTTGNRTRVFRCALLRNNRAILRNIRGILRYFQKNEKLPFRNNAQFSCQELSGNLSSFRSNAQFGSPGVG